MKTWLSTNLRRVGLTRSTGLLSGALLLTMACGEEPSSPAPTPAVEMTWGLEVQDLDPALLAVAPLGSTGDLLAVGGPLAGDGAPFLTRRSATGWEDVPPPAGWRGAVWWSWSASPDDVWVVGERGQIARGPLDQLVLRTDVETSTQTVFYGVWGSAPDDVWIVGGASRGPSGSTGTILRWDGTRLSQVRPTETASIADTVALFKVWGSGRDDVMVVGASGLAIAWDGVRWDKTNTRTSFQLTTVHGRGPYEKYVVGGLSQGTVLRFDGFSWREIGPAFAPPLSAVWAAEDALWVAGESGFLARWDGIEWTEIGTEMFRSFHAVHVANGAVFGVGGILAASPEPRMGFAGRYGPAAD